MCFPTTSLNIFEISIIKLQFVECVLLLIIAMQRGMDETFGSTCHGAGRALIRSAALRKMTSGEVMQSLRQKGIILKIASPKLVAEEAAEAYKDVSHVVQTCHDAGISKLCVRLRPLIVCKG